MRVSAFSILRFEIEFLEDINRLSIVVIIPLHHIMWKKNTILKIS